MSAYLEPVNISVMLLDNTSFIVNWTISDPSYNYTVILTNLSTGVTNSSIYTVPENTNSYTLAGLGGNATYNVSVSVMDLCGVMITSDTITVNSKHKLRMYAVNLSVIHNTQHMYRYVASYVAWTLICHTVNIIIIKNLRTLIGTHGHINCTCITCSVHI